MPDVSASFTSGITGSINGSVNLDSLANKGIYSSASGSLTITGGNIPVGKWVVINAPNTTVTISSDIKYSTGRIYSINDIPQVVIIAKEINILETVGNIDSWLVASGKINTCSNYGDTNSLTINKCNKQLTINGPVMASKLYLRRTAGAGLGTATGDPAEVINLRADAYLWSYARAKDNGGSARTTYNSEAPTRF